METRRKVVAIDGNSLLYRAFYAMKPLSTPEGVPTNAIYGFTLMLQRILQEEKPDAVAVAFDSPAKTFRHLEYEAYKAHRKPTPDELRAQAPIARRLVKAFNIVVLEVPGFEADDIVGTIARQADDAGWDTLIVTGDLDELQLVNDSVRVMTTIKGVTDVVRYDRQAVLDRFGVLPSQLADFKGLKGDPSDNIPGVPGVGEKTAAKLIGQFGSVEAMLAHIEEIEDPKLRARIEQFREQAVLSKRLATIVTDVPLDVGIDGLTARPPATDTLRELFTELGFRTLLRRIPETTEPTPSTDVAPAPTASADLGPFRIAESPADVERLLSELQRTGSFVLRVHTAGGKPTESKVLGIAFSTGRGGTYVRVSCDQDAGVSNRTLSLGMDDVPFAVDVSFFRSVLESPDIGRMGHDLKQDIESLALCGVNLARAEFDTMIGAYVLNSGQGESSLAEISLEHLGIAIPSRGASTGVENVLCAEAAAASALAPVLREKLEKEGLFGLTASVEMPLVPVLAAMEMSGVAVDTDHLGRLSTLLAERIVAAEQQIYSEAGHEFSIGSPKQLQSVLFDQMQLPSGRKTKSGLSTDADTLDALAPLYPIVRHVLEWRELTKLRQTYAEALPKLINPRTGRLHTSLNQAVASTGRLSSSDPNLQNIPVRTEIGREIRKAFVAPAGNVLLTADYSQIELRILAHITGDPEMVRAFEQNEDIHTHTASTLFGVPEDQVTPDMRRSAKTVNFAVIYGMSDFRLGRALGIPVRDAHDFTQRYFARFPGVRRYTEETIESARRMGFVTTAIGRRRYIADINNSNHNARMFAERAAVNMPIQGAAADAIKIAMIDIHTALEARPCRSRMVLQVHDELVFECPEDEVASVSEMVKRLMEGAFRLSVPVVADVKVGRNWAEMAPAT